MMSTCNHGNLLISGHFYFLAGVEMKRKLRKHAQKKRTDRRKWESFPVGILAQSRVPKKLKNRQVPILNGCVGL